MLKAHDLCNIHLPIYREILLQLQILLSSNTLLLDGRDHTPLEAFDFEQPFAVNGDEEERANCRRLFVRLLEEIEVKTATVGHDCWKD